MSKSALGRGLGSLMSSRPSEPADSSEVVARVTPGVATLISGNRETCTANQRPTADGSPSSAGTPKQEIVQSKVQGVARTTRLRWMLVAADAMLCGMAAVILLRSPKLRPEEIALAIAAVLLGAWLGCSAWMLGRDPQQ